jgi:glycosyltransferase involved in cell wall biosynthesis
MILYDYTDTFHFGKTTGIQRVVKELGFALSEKEPSDFVLVIQTQGQFYPVPVGASPDGFQLPIHPIHEFIRRMGAGPLSMVRKWSNESRILSRFKAKLWEILDSMEMQSTAIQPKVGDWYLTADAIWNWPQILSKLPSLRAQGVRTAIVHHDLTPVTHPWWHPPVLRELFLPYAEALPSCDIVFCVSEFARREFLKFCRERDCPTPKKVVTIPLGCEIMSDGTRSRANAIMVPEGPFVLYVGTLEPRKNHGSLLDGFDILWARDLGLSLVIVGKPGYGSEGTLSRIYKHPRLGTNLIYFPNCDDGELEELYRRCAFTVYPSLFEGYGLPVLESLARGKPCVCSDIAVFHEIAGSFGIYFNPEDPSSIATQIESLHLDPARLESLIASLRANYRPPSWKDSGRAVLGSLGYAGEI